MASETVVAVFANLSDAEAAISDLVAAGVPSASIKHYARDDSDSEFGTTRSETETEHHGGFWAWLTGQETTHEHHELYNRSIESGRTVVTVISDGSNIDQIYATLERHEPIDLDERDGVTSEYGNAGRTTATTTDTGVAGVGGASAGYTGPGATGAGTTGAGTTGVGTTAAAYRDTPATGTGETTRTGDAYEEHVGATGAAGAGFEPRTAAPTDTTRTGNTEEVIPLSEENLEIGKREVDRGSTRIRRYVVERPVDEQIRLRDETVTVFRRPAGSAAAAGADAFKDREVVVTESNEEAVVAKTARVVEEVVVQKGVQERVETVHDTVRREEVEIDGPAGKLTETDRTPGSKI